MVGDDGLPVTKVGAWTLEKHERLVKYVDITRGVRRRFVKTETTYVELFVAPAAQRSTILVSLSMATRFSPHEQRKQTLYLIQTSILLTPSQASLMRYLSASRKMPVAFILTLAQQNRLFTK
jgi:hypothetical protein